MRKMLLSVLCAGVLFAQPAWGQQATPPVGYKDPGTATLLSVVVPGGGQLYSGDTRKGLTILGVGLGGLTLGTAMTMESTNGAPMLLGYAVYVGSWIYGIIDADDSARRMNSKHGLAHVLPENVMPVVAPDGTGGTQVGVTIRF